MKKSLFLMMAACLSVVAAVAQDASPVSGLSLSLQEASDYAVEHNRNIQNASLSVRQAEAQRWQSIASMLPQVSLSLDYQNMCGYEMDMGSSSSSSDADYSWVGKYSPELQAYTLDLGSSLKEQMGGGATKIPLNPNGTLGLTVSAAVSGQQIVGVLLSDLAIEMSDVAVSKTSQMITSNVNTVYVSILALEQTVELLNRNLQNVTDMALMQEKAVEVGSAEQLEADKIRVQVASLKNGINSTERQVKNLYNTLRLLLGVGADTEVTLSQTLDDVVNAETIMELLSHELQLDDNYDYRLARKQVELADMQRKMAWMAYVPTLSAYYRYSAKTYFGEEARFNMTPPNTVGVTLSVPIWSSGRNAAAITEKRRALEVAENNLADQKDQLEMNDQQYRFTLTSSYEDYQLQKDNIEVTQRVYDNVANKYKYGYASGLDLTNASTNLINAQNSYVSSLTQMVSAYVNLKNLLNK